MKLGLRGRLFWKLLLALWLSMLLSVFGAFAYFHLTDPWRHGPPPPPDSMSRDDARTRGAMAPGRAGNAGRQDRAASATGLASGPEFGPGPDPRRGPRPRPPGLPLVPLASGALASLLMSVVLAWYLSQPIRHLRQALRQAAEERFDLRLRPLLGKRRDELVDLADDFDRMADQLARLQRTRQQLLHDISHELRSPLTRLQAAVGLVRQDEGDVPTLLARIERETERLDALIEELLTLHRLEADAKAPCERVDVQELLQAVVDDACFEAQAVGRSVHLQANAPFVAEVHGEMLCRALDNVIRNAVKFSPPGGRVDVQTLVLDEAGEDGLWQCQVLDRGPGVPEDMLEAIFQPFKRVEGGEAVPGTGLGLAIAWRAMQLHGGQIVARARRGGGLVVTLSLPRVRAV